MTNTSTPPQIFNKYAQVYQEKFMDVSLYHKTFDFFCEAVKPKNASILELACGPGNITKYLLYKRDDFNVLGTDLAPNMIELAEANNPKAGFMLLNSKNVLSLNKKFDAIMSGFFLPYLSIEETSQLISDSSKILNPNGVIYISTIEANYKNSGLKKGSQGDEIYMYYYQEKDLIKMLEENNFTPTYIKRIISTDTNEDTVTDLIIIAKLN
ncbi:MAG: class I SAM-dependent methyltransferase [Flavobacteriales bacterium]|nr:class I SAM-dependent methyltransferase [Flavobacteriales bacterium]